MIENDLARAYSEGDLCGWLEERQPGIVRSSFTVLNKQNKFAKFNLVSEVNTKAMLYLCARKLIGKDITNYPQEIGDCVSFGLKNAAEILQATQAIINGEALKWRPVFPPWYYGASRVYVGKNQMNGDGSVGSWGAIAARDYGTIFSDEPGCPRYSGSIARAWGDRDPSPDIDKWKLPAAQFLVQGVARILTWDKLVAAVLSGYPLTIASNVGFEEMPRRDGFHYRKGKWPHQMCIVGVDNREKDPYAIIQNSWHDVHGRLKDFDDGHDLPIGCLRVRRIDIEAILSAKDSYALSNMKTFRDNSAKLQREFFRIL
jgi:hypothetical protein